MYLTGKHMSRRTALRGLGATIALPLLDSMISARTAFASTGAGMADRTRLVCIEQVHGAAGAANSGPRSSSGTRLWSAVSSISARAASVPRTLPRLPDHRQQHRYADGRSVLAGRSRRRPFPLERGDVYARAAEADGRIGRPGRHVDGSCTCRSSQDTPIPSMQLSIEPVDQSGGCAYGYACVYTDTISGRAGPAAADGAGSAHGLRIDVRRRRHTGTAHAAPRHGPQHPRHADVTDGGLRARWGRPTGSASISTPRTSAKSNSASSAWKRATPAARLANCQRTGVPDAFDEHVKLMFDLQLLAFTSDTTRVFSIQARTRRVRARLSRQRHRYGSTTPLTTAWRKNASVSSPRSTNITCRCSALPGEVEGDHRGRLQPPRQDPHRLWLAHGERQRPQSPQLPADSWAAAAVR